MVAYIDEAGKVQLKDKKKNKKINAQIKKALGREYTQEQIDALSMADTELMLEVAPYLKDRPKAKIALDAHLFDIGAMPQKQFKTKLLNIVSDFNQETKLPDYYDSKGNLNAVTGTFAGTYNSPKDKITIKKSGKIGEDLKTGEVDYDRRKTIFTLIHELEHRGAKLIDAIANRFGNEERDHKAIAFSDEVTAKDLGIKYQSKYKGDSGSFFEQQKETYDLLRKRPEVAKRFPSIKKEAKEKFGYSTGYNKGGKVYSNMQSRKVRI
jgi:hypothetical protein